MSIGWNYRVIKFPQDEALVKKLDIDTHYYKIMEVYYDKKGNPSSYGEASAVNEDLKTLNADMKLQMKALEKNIVVVDKDYKFLGYEENSEVQVAQKEGR